MSGAAYAVAACAAGAVASVFLLVGAALLTGGIAAVFVITAEEYLLTPILGYGGAAAYEYVYYTAPTIFTT
jgi:hypothetical protein